MKGTSKLCTSQSRNVPRNNLNSTLLSRSEIIKDIYNKKYRLIRIVWYMKYINPQLILILLICNH